MSTNNNHCASSGMSRASTTFSISLPPQMVEQIERARKSEHRTRSEFVREALRQYIGRASELRRLRERIAQLAEEEPTAEEMEAIEEGRRAFREGRFVTIDKVRHGLARNSKQSRRKKSQAHSGS
jgi:Arc/MetJ-type ribon-helix-helix transcriptional regulator